MLRKKRRILALIGLLIMGYFAFSSIIIYRYSNMYFEDKSDVAIVLGAGTTGDQVSPVFRERINHAIYLYKKELVDKVILTGGFGEGQIKSDSQIAKDYAVNNGVLDHDVLIEETSRYTIENLIESKLIMDSMGLKTALIVSDPLHMKRSMEMAQDQEIDCKPSPTRTSMYRTTIPKIKSLMYETFFFSSGQIVGVN